MSQKRPSIVNMPHALKPWAGSFVQTTVLTNTVMNLFGAAADATHVYALPVTPTPANPYQLTVPPQKPLYLVLTVESNAIRWTSDGTTPTSTVGFLVNPYSSPLIMSSNEAENFKCIAITGSATINTQRYDE